ncbi:MAG: hypothetical protein H2172_01595 [Opitutus sp.]|nr:hypothetical protein [Opitutus sp.]MCS6277098.1 hypothetical protein [Opitutus sp.]MCS6300220.1 hypothetical protein [Opitutus sp.]
MTFDLDQRTASLSIGEFAAFTIGPREPSDHTGPQGLWRARLGTRWHQELRATASVATPATTFEVPLTGQVFHGRREKGGPEWHLIRPDRPNGALYHSLV